MPFNVSAPKYAQVVSAIQAQIETGTYPPGSVLPSEHQLVAQFGVSRPTVVRALDILRQQGWIDAEQGRGRFVRGRPDLAKSSQERHGSLILDGSGTGLRSVIVAQVAPPLRVVTLLGAGIGPAVLLRRSVRADSGIPFVLVSAYFPLDIAQGTDLHSEKPINGGIRHHLKTRKRITINHVTETVTARMPNRQEARLLDVGARIPMLSLWVVARDGSTRALVVAEALLPGDRHELEDTYELP